MTLGPSGAVEEILPVQWSLLEVENALRSRLAVDIILIEAGGFFTAVEESAVHLSQALGYRIGIDRWGRRISGLPVPVLEDRLALLEELDWDVVVVRTLGYRGRRAIRAISHTAGAARLFPGMEEPAVASTSREPSQSPPSARVAPTAPEGAGPLLTSLEFSLMLKGLGPVSAANEPVVEALREVWEHSRGPVSSEHRAAMRERLLDGRVSLLDRSWRHYLRHRDPSILKPLTVEEDVGRLAQRVLRMSPRRRRASDGVWSEHEVAITVEQYKVGRLLVEVAAAVDRPQVDVRQVLERQGLPSGLWPTWTRFDEKERDRLVRRRTDLAECVHELARSPWDIALSALAAGGGR